MAIPVQSPQYGAYGQTGPKYTPPNMFGGTAQPQAGAGFDMNAMLQAFMMLAQMQQQGQTQRSQQGIQADIGQQREATGGIRRDISGNPIDPNAQGPWSGPITFPSAQERYQQMVQNPFMGTIPPRTAQGTGMYKAPPRAF